MLYFSTMTTSSTASQIPMTEIVATLSDRIAARKLVGEDDTSLVRKLCALGLDEVTAQRAISEVVSERLRSESKLRRWRRHIESLLDAHRTLNQLAPQFREIQRLHKPDPQEFLENFYSKGIPVVLTGIMDGWPALEKWNSEYLRTNYGGLSVEVMMRRESDSNYELNKDEHKTRVKFADFLDIVDGPSSNDAYMVAHNFALSGSLADLIKDVGDIPGLLRSPENVTEFNFWLGPKGTVTPLHHDSSNVLLGQIWGAKHITIYPWSEFYLLYNEVAGFSRFDPENPDFKKYPLSARATQMRTTIRAGEALFLPVGTWHQVRSLAPSISLSMSQFVFPNEFTLYDP
jgi:hypothetical protein